MATTSHDTKTYLQTPANPTVTTTHEASCKTFSAFVAVTLNECLKKVSRLGMDIGVSTVAPPII